MVFLILAILAFLLLFVFKTYRSVPAAASAILFIFGITSAVLGWGITAYSGGGRLFFFSGEIGSREFYYLITAWYVADVLCSVLIIRNLRAYKRVNSGNDRRADRPGAAR